jgi:DNA-binding transcriptional LysR family regulator
MRRHIGTPYAPDDAMARPDLNLLVTLDVLLGEGSVAGAARRLRLSPSAMSRALARLRAATGDPLLVRAGSGLVPSPRALELRERVSQLVHDAEAALRPATALELGQLDRTFTLRSSEGFVENFGAGLLARVAEEAPGVRLRFLLKLDKDSAPLRDGTVDLETGVVGKTTGPEVRARALFSDRFIGVVRTGHPLSEGEMTRARYAAARHIRVSRRGTDKSPIDDALTAFGLQREIATTVGDLRAGMHGFALPVPVPPVTVSLLWHPRLDGDLAHRWLRGCIRDACAAQLRDAPTCSGFADG